MDKETNIFFFKTLVGSQAHGLATPESDRDYRGVFIQPTGEILSLGSKPRTTSWFEGDEDNTSWELGHFLNLATKCNPTVLEVFFAPVESVNAELNQDYKELMELFPHLWNSKGVKDAFMGYGYSQRKKLLENKDNRSHKYASAYLRVLIQAKELLSTGQFRVDFRGHPQYEYIKSVKTQNSDNGFDISLGAIINKCSELEKAVEDAFTANPAKETDVAKANAFLLKVRKNHM